MTRAFATTTLAKVKSLGMCPQSEFTRCTEEISPNKILLLNNQVAQCSSRWCCHTHIYGYSLTHSHSLLLCNLLWFARVSGDGGAICGFIIPFGVASGDNSSCATTPQQPLPVALSLCWGVNTLTIIWNWISRFMGTFAPCKVAFTWFASYWPRQFV